MEQMEKKETTLVFGMPVLIADDDEFFRMALRSILLTRLGVSDVIETSSFDEAIEVLAREPNLRLALFDLNMPGMNNWDDLRSVREVFPAVITAVVSASSARSDILRALDCGVHGYVTKGLGISELGNALQRISEGSVYVPASLPDTFGLAKTETMRQAEAASSRDGPIALGKRALSPRQKQILELLVAGSSNKAMARSLNLSEGTIKFHISAVFRVLGATNRVEAATAGSRLLLELDNQDCDSMRTKPAFTVLPLASPMGQVRAIRQANRH